MQLGEGTRMVSLFKAAKKSRLFVRANSISHCASVILIVADQIKQYSYRSSEKSTVRVKGKK